ncbi:hypothetical protein [Streptomyces sp. CC228A]|uniref:hypothetical protein n=1 Tax=Streptomyces sp. CC228A TaxID=2898186 RepID=UPI001F3A914E|nr:hypothetical protein [Streptomyces sp. CC228A]
MTDHTGRAGLEKDELYAVAREFEPARHEIVGSYTTNSLPDLVTASHHLTALTGLVKDLSDEVLFRATDNDPGLDFGPVIAAYTSASTPAGRAVNNYTEAFEQLGFLRRYAEAPPSADLRDARQAAFGVAQDRLDLTVDSLQETVVALRHAADRIDGTPPRVLAALSRSARPANSIYRVPATRPAAEPTRLAYMPVSRHAR